MSVPSPATDAALVEEELRALEPVVHSGRYHGASREQIAGDLDERYEEIASTGIVYRRAEVLDSLVVFHRERHPETGVSDLRVRPIADGTWLCTYTLTSGDRRTLRATIWQWSGARWRAVFHQGTVAA